MNKRKWLALLLCVAVALTMFPIAALAEDDAGLCPHHAAHTADCGYEEGVSPCAHVCRICPVQALIDALPDADGITADNADAVGAQLDAVDAAKASLSGDERDALDFSRYDAAIAKLDELSGTPGASTPTPLDTSVEYLDCDSNGQNWQTRTCDSATAVTSTDTTWSDGWYVVNSDVTNGNRIEVSGNVNLILADGFTLNVTDGIHVPSGSSLTIYGQANGTGKLVATAKTEADGGAGIGSNYTEDAGAITINGGIIEAKGYNGGAGIGGGHTTPCTSITINGGSVTATGGACSGNGSGAGIGCGFSKAGGSVIINGGVVNANGNGMDGQNAPGIGGGSTLGATDTTSVTITGGTVTANGYEDSAGISGVFKATGNAVVYASSITDTSSEDTWRGIIYKGDTGTVYGDQTLSEDLTIPGGKTLTTPAGTTLTIPEGVTLTIEGTLNNNGTIINQGAIIGTVTGNQPKSVSVKYLDADGTSKTAWYDAEITADNIGDYTTLSTGWYVVKGDVTATSRITVSGEVHLILADGCSFTVNGGIDVSGSNSLSIYAQSTDESTMGKLTANAGDSSYNAGIGGGNYQSGGTITINGGTVKATGGYGAAGIGGSYNSGGTTTINGGAVKATGGQYAAGIGGGNSGTGGTITISGGKVEATGGQSGAGIGGGFSRSGGEITISSGTVFAEGGNSGGAGIGGGSSGGSGGQITIKGGTVTAKGGSSNHTGAAGIGGGSNGTGGIIAISGGTVTASGSKGGAGIGGGNGKPGEKITISGGTVTAEGGNNGGAGIGGGTRGSGGTITISGGTVTATGSDNGAGIGGGYNGSGGTITISNGIVTATGGKQGGAGIGGGSNGSGGSIAISGGTVNATGGNNAAGIGKGFNGSDGTFTTTDSGSAVIFASKISDQTGKAEDAANPWRGVIFEGNVGKVYGDNVATTTDFTIPQDATLTIDSGKTLVNSYGVTIENYGTINIYGTLTNSGTIINYGNINGAVDGTPAKLGVKYLDATGAEKSTEDAVAITSDYLTTNNHKLPAGWYVVKDTVTATSRITVSGEVHLILADGCNFTVTGGIDVRSGNSLSIYAQSTEVVPMGKLVAVGTGSSDAGIGGSDGGSCGAITINGGSITATGGTYGAGIGGGREGSGGTITINGGAVNATGGTYGAGIGGGEKGSGGTITINGGAVEATGSYTGAGIGGGDKGSGDTITINGGAVTAKSRDMGAGIGGGNKGSGGKITITGGTVLESSGFSGAGIGGGYDGSGDTIIISGGTVFAFSGYNGAGIGGGCRGISGGSGGNITISGGTVTANSYYSGCAGIGNGLNGSGGTFTTTDSGNAVIFASSIYDQSGKTSNSWRGVIFEGNDGKIYGANIAPSEDFTMDRSKTLLIQEGAELDVSGITAANNGKVYVDGALSGSFGGTGGIYYGLTVNGGTASPTNEYNSKTYGKMGATVTLTPDIQPGQKVESWEVTPSNAVTVAENNTFTMPAQALSIKAILGAAPTYTVTIPATVELGETQTVTVSASGVSIVKDYQLVVKLTDAQGFKLKNAENVELGYSITLGGNTISTNDAVLTVKGGTENSTGSATLTVTPDTPLYAGNYTGAVTFTISVEEITPAP
ncbi:MAG: beta strand repeat-containing protein [Candidatus Spyradocola sp.]